MAFCPHCSGEIQQTAGVCPHCGYDFPEPAQVQAKEGIAYSWFADVSLAVGMVVIALACLSSLVGSVVALAKREWLDALVRGPMMFFILLAVLVVFLRVQDLGRKK